MGRTVHIWVNKGEMCRKHENPKTLLRFIFEMTPKSCFTYPQIPKFLKNILGQEQQKKFDALCLSKNRSVVPDLKEDRKFAKQDILSVRFYIFMSRVEKFY